MPDYALPVTDPNTGEDISNLPRIRVTPQLPVDPYSGNPQFNDISEVPQWMKKLTGTGGEERYQFWPERMIRSGLTVAGDVAEGKLSTDRDPITGKYYSEVDYEPNWIAKNIFGSGNFRGPAPGNVIERVQDMSGLAGMSTIGRSGKITAPAIMEDTKAATALAAFNNHANEMKAKYGNQGDLWISKQSDAELAKFNELQAPVNDYINLKQKAEKFGLIPEEYLAGVEKDKVISKLNDAGYPVSNEDAKLALSDGKITQTEYNIFISKKNNLDNILNDPKNRELLEPSDELGKFAKHKIEMINKYGDNWVAEQTNAEHNLMNKFLKEDKESIKLDNGLTLTPVRHNPFAELETGIKEAAKGVVRDEKLPINTAAQNLINKRIEFLKNELDHVIMNTKNKDQEKLLTNKLDELRAKRRELEDHASPTTDEFSKITNYALDYADRINPKGRAKRMAAQGFEDEAFHGAKEGWQDLNVKAPRDYGFYSTGNPELAEMYAGKTNTYRQPNIMPLKINTSEYLTVDAKGKGWTDINDKAIAKAKEEGKKGVVIHNVYDEPASGKLLGAPKTVYITLDPTTVRSKFAKFDENNVGKNGIMFEDSKISTAVGSDGKERKLIPVNYNPYRPGDVI